MSPNDIVLTGIPRSGTTLCCHLLHRCQDTVALVEPLAVQDIPIEPGAAVRWVDRQFDVLRAQARDSGHVPSFQVGGKVPDNPMAASRGESGLRLREAVLGLVDVGKPLSADFTLVIKHNAAFTALLPELSGVASCYGVVRNPLAVLASWNSVDLPVARGHVPAGERLDPVLARTLAAEPSVVRRQLRILDWCFARYGRYLSASRVLRYEDVIAGRGERLGALTPHWVAPPTLASRNANRLYSRELVNALSDALLRGPGEWRAFYSPEDVAGVADALLHEDSE